MIINDMKKVTPLSLLVLTLSLSITQCNNFRMPKIHRETKTLLMFSPYMNTHFLADYDKVRNFLIRHDNFKETSFSSTDNISISALFRQNSKARANIIVLAGWLPGRVEGSASLVPLIPEKEYNLLLVNVRGHGKSTGHSPLIDFPSFGTSEYHDVISAIEFLYLTTQKPIIVWGTCAGAFHAAHALIHLSENDLLSTYGVKGLVFDSGWASVTQVSQETAQAMIKKKISNRWIQQTSLAFFKMLYSGLIKHIQFKNESTTNLYDKIQMLTTPTFYIHAKNDSRAYFEHVVTLYKKTPQAIHWWLEKSSHAVHQLKHKYQYRDKLLEFCETTLSQE